MMPLVTLLKACLNGPRRPGAHPALPVTPTQLAADVPRVVAAGAGAVHLHVKDADGGRHPAGPRGGRRAAGGAGSRHRASRWA